MTIDIYSLGICHASVCAPREVTEAEVTAALNESRPTGISSDWEPSPDPAFESGEPNPCPCNDEPTTRLHWLMVC